MERERKFKIVALVAVIIAVIGLSIAFAAMSRTLNINGSGNVDPANFDIYFTNLSQPTLKGEASVSGTPTLATKGVTISNMNVTLKKPNDSVVYKVDIKNDGDIDAEIENLVLPTFTSAQQQLFDFTVVYTNGGQAVQVGDTLAKGETRNVTITFKYKDITDESLLPSVAQQISLSYKIIYKQTNNAVTTAAQGSQYGNEIASKEITPGIFATYYGGTPMAKSETGIVQMSNDNRVADDVRYEGGTLVISGTGTVADGDYSIQMFLADINSLDEIQVDENELPIYKYNPTTLVIEEGITRLGVESFSSILSISNVIFPNTLIEIGNDAFSNCLSLDNIDIPNSVTQLGRAVFASSSVRSIRIGTGINTITDGLLSGCTNLKTVYLSSNITSIQSGGFTNVENATFYCETQEVANLFNSGNVNYSKNQFIVDPTKFN